MDKQSHIKNAIRGIKTQINTTKSVKARNERGLTFDHPPERIEKIKQLIEEKEHKIESMGRSIDYFEKEYEEDKRAVELENIITNVKKLMDAGNIEAAKNVVDIEHEMIEEEYKRKGNKNVL